MAEVKRCTRCNICPQPQDVGYFWGNTPEDLAEKMCKKCRSGAPLPLINPMPMVPFSQPKPEGRAMVIMVTKLTEMPVHLISEYLLGNNLRDCLRLRTYNTSLYITDGERLWPYKDFPGNRSTPMDWSELLEKHGEAWDMYEPTGSGLSIMAEEEVADGTGDIPTDLPNFSHIMM